MNFTTVCTTDAVREGGMGLFQVGKKSVLLLWPTGGELKAYRGRCPHADMPLTDATFDGRAVKCPHHQWGFDAASGKCVTHAVRNALHACSNTDRFHPWNLSARRIAVHARDALRSPRTCVLGLRRGILPRAAAPPKPALPHPLRIQGDAIQVDVGPVKPPRQPA